MKRQVVDGEGVYMLYNRLRRGKNTVCILTVTKTDLDITLYERESRQLF